MCDKKELHQVKEDMSKIESRCKGASSAIRRFFEGSGTLKDLEDVSRHLDSTALLAMVTKSTVKNIERNERRIR